MSDETNDNERNAAKPQVIDLAAEDVTETQAHDRTGEAPQQAAPAVPPKPRPRRKFLRWLVLALLVGAAGGGWFYRDVLSTYLPDRATVELQSRIAALEAGNKTLQDQLSAMSASVEAASGAAASAGQSVKDLAGTVNGAGEKLDGFDKRLAAAEAAVGAAKSDLDGLRNAISMGASTAGSTGGGETANAPALAALGQRVDTLEKDVGSLKAGLPAAQDVSVATALSQTLSDLKAKIAAGSAYQDDYDRIARMVPAAQGLDDLGRHAALGLPNAKGLAAELQALIPSLPAPEAPAASTTGYVYLDKLWDGVTSIVTVRNIGESDWRAAAGRAAAMTDAGDVAGAIALVDAAEGTKPSGLSQWRERAAARLQLEKALEETSGAVLRQITSLGGAK